MSQSVKYLVCDERFFDYRNDRQEEVEDDIS